MFFKLRVLKHLELADGRIFLPGHDANQLSRPEVEDLVTNNPGCFEAGNELTEALLEELASRE